MLVGGSGLFPVLNNSVKSEKERNAKTCVRVERFSEGVRTREHALLIEGREPIGKVKVEFLVLSTELSPRPRQIGR